jgi:Zn-dependent peptidase ImmA (M78 family)
MADAQKPPEDKAPKLLFGGTYQQVEELAARLRGIVDTQVGSDKSLKEKLKWLVSSRGGSVCVGENYDPSLTIYSSDHFVITLHSLHSGSRDSWTIIHEMGHYFLHYNEKGHTPDEAPVVFWRYGNDHFEWQCNRFAAAFTMPAKEFREWWTKTGGNDYRMASHFEIPTDPIKVRAKYIMKEDDGES